MQHTLFIIKPDAVKKNAIGQIISMMEAAGLSVVGQKMMHISKNDAEKFYAEHSHRPFFSSLVEFMTSGPVVVGVLSGIDAVLKYRDLMGATDPSNALPGTIRAKFGNGIEQNAVHGSDSSESAAREVGFFFSKHELFV